MTKPCNPSTDEHDGERSRTVEEAERRFLTDHAVLLDKQATLGCMAYELAHEIRNPLQSIRAALELLSPPAPVADDDTDGGTHRLGPMAIREIDRLAELLRAILPFGRPDPPSGPKVCELARVVDQVSVLMTSTCSMHGVAATMRCPEGLPKLACDEGHLVQVLVDLSRNAVRAMQRGGRLTVSARLDVGSITGPRVSVDVEDTGCGIPATELPHLFDLFHRHRRNGTGLGLYVVQSLVALMDGEITVRSVVGQGTTFTIALPIHDDRRTE